MFYNLVLACIFIFVCWLWGSAFAKVLNLNKNLLLFEVSLGFIWMVLILNLLYFRMDLDIKEIKILIAVISIFVCIFIFRKIEKRSLCSLCFVLLFFALSASLAYISYYRGFGENFYVFRGNIDDNFNYVSVGYAVLKHNFSYYLNVTEDVLFKENDLLIWGADRLMNDRPSVTLPFALILKEGKGSIFLSAYLYMSVLYSMFAPVLYYFYRCLMKNRMPAIRCLLLASYLLGFWGQLHFDLNAWSQLGGIPIIFTIIRFVLLELENKDRKIERRILLSVSITAAFLIYPEASMVYAGGIGIYLLLYYIRKRDSTHLKDILKWFIIICFSACLLIIVNSNYRMAFSFMKGQLIGGITIKQDWWKIFDSYWVGKNASDHVITNSLNHVISFFGFYFLIPPVQGSANIFLIAVEMLFILTIVSGIGIGFIQFLKKSKDELSIPFLWNYFFCYSILLILYLLWQKNYWVLGKLMVWMSPFLYYMITCFIGSGIVYFRKYYIVFGGVLIGANMLFCAARVGQAWNGTNEWYNNYPLHQWLRDSVEWKLDMEALGESKVIRVEDEFSGHYLHYLKQTICFAGKEYYSSGNMLLPYGNGKDYGKMPFKNYDAFVYLDAGESGKRKMKYTVQLNGRIPSDIIYQKIGLNPGSVFVEKSGGFLSDIYGSWTSENTAKLKLLEPLPYDKLELTVTVNAFARAQTEENGKPLYIKIGSEQKRITINDVGSYSVFFENVGGQNEIYFYTGQLLTPYELGWADDKKTLYGVRIQTMELKGEDTNGKQND